MLPLEQVDHLCPCPEHRTIAVSCHHMCRTVSIESGIKSHTCAYTNAFYLTFHIDTGGHSVPAELCHRTIGLRVKPTLIDAVGQTIGIDSGGR